jgi:hypothetical protein
MMFKVNRISSRNVGKGRMSIAIMSRTSAGIPMDFQSRFGIR